MLWKSVPIPSQFWHIMVWTSGLLSSLCSHHHKQCSYIVVIVTIVIIIRNLVNFLCKVYARQLVESYQIGCTHVVFFSGMNCWGRLIVGIVHRENRVPRHNEVHRYRITVWCHYNEVNFKIFTNSDVCPASITEVKYTVSCSIGPCYTLYCILCRRKL